MAARNKKWQPGIKMAEKGSKNFSRFMRHFPTTNYYLPSLLYQRFWLGSHTLAIYTYSNREVDHSFDYYFSEYYTERAFE